MQHRIPQVDASQDLYPVHRLQSVGDLVSNVAGMHAHAGGELFGSGIELVEVVVTLIEVVAHLFVRCADRTSHAAVAPVVGCGCELIGGNPIPAVQVHHGLGEFGMAGDQIGDLLGVGAGDHVLVHHHLTHFGDQSRIVLRIEK